MAERREAGHADRRVGVRTGLLHWHEASPLVAILVVLLALGASWAATYAGGGAGHVPPHLFYLPILLAAARFGLAGALLTGAAAGILAGPLLPLDVPTSAPQELSDWGLRAGFFLALGSVMALLFGRLRSALDRERKVLEGGRKLAAQKAALVQTVSHEFRSPLTVILGVTRTLEDLDLVAEEGRSLVGSLKSAAERLDGLLMGLLAASRMLEERRSAAHRSVDLGGLCRGIAGQLDHFGGSERVHLDLAPDADALVSDPELLRLLLGSVVENALKFSPDGSPVDVRSRRAAGQIIVEIRDRGPGIAEDFRERAFEAFTQHDQSTTREHGGLGIGLYVARNLVGHLGGRIEVRDAAGGGTQAELWLPQRRDSDRSLQTRTPHS